MSNPKEQDGIQEILQSLQDGLAADEHARLSDELTELHPSEIAEILESLPSKDRIEIWDLVRPELEGDVLTHANDQVRISLLEDMHPHEVANATQGLDTDDAVDILQDLPARVQEEVLFSMDEQNRSRISQVLSYPEDTAGGLMDTNTVSIRADVTLDVVTRYMRLHGEIPDRKESLFVVDRKNTYLGVLPLIRILTREPDMTVAEVMITHEEGIPASMDEKDVARIFDKMDLITAAVVDEEGMLLGEITVDDVVDVIKEQGERSLMNLAGLDEEDDMFAPVMESASRRTIWLGVNLATAFLAAWVIGLFEATIQQLVALAILMPVVASMGGIAGSQTLTIVIRGIALGHIGSANARALLTKEILVGLVNSVIWAVVVGLVSGFWFENMWLGFVIGAAIVINLLSAALFGAVIPLALKRLNVDPALAGGVVLTTVTDVVGFMAFLGLASLYLV